MIKNKKVVAVEPYRYTNNSNFKVAPYIAWENLGGECIRLRKYEKYYESFSYHVDLPSFDCCKDEARLRFVEGACVRFDTFPDYITHEVIPVIWDCWPSHFENMAKWFKKHDVKTAFFTSSQTADRMRKLYPNKNIYHLAEAIETNLYKKGGELSKRNYDFLEYGRVCYYVNTNTLPNNVRILSSRCEQGILKNRGMLIDALSDAKITICLPRCINQPEIAGDIETLTQRYWECMLSRVVIIGKAPKELIDIIGYDPVINLDRENFSGQVQDILQNIDSYQDLVNRNRETALRYGDWENRIKYMMDVLEQLGYLI